MEFIKKTNIDFMGMRNIAYVLSGAMMLISVIFIFAKTPKWGIDFLGGTLVHVKFSEDVTAAQIRKVLAAAGINPTSIQQFRGSKAAMITLKKDDTQEKIDENISSALISGLAGVQSEITGVEMVGPSVGSYLKEKAVMALLFAFMGIIVYVAWRFKGGVWGFAGVLALFHDVLITFGLLNILGYTIDLNIVAGLLTLAGYSINDTIVIYDRIREGIKIHYKKPLNNIINISINETMSRTMITVGTTLMVVFSLFMWGGDVLRGFSVTMLIGCVIGTYSTVFCAAPIVYDWQRRK